jgi:hypothetical protein
MTKLINAIKAATLFTSLAIVGMASTPGTAEAVATFCENPGHSCHVEINGTLYHLEEIV